MQVDISYLLILLVMLYILYYVCRAAKFPIIAPARLFLIPWIGSVILITSNVIHFDNVFTVDSFFSITLSLVAFVVGAILIKGRFKYRKIRNNNYAFSRSSILILTFFSAIYILLVSQDILTSSILKGGINIDFNGLRQEHWEEHEVASVNLTSILKSIGRSATFILGCSWLILKKSKNNKLLSLLALVGIIMIVFENLIDAGRSLATYLVFCILYLQLLLRYRANSSKRYLPLRTKLRIGIFGLLLVYLLLGVFPFLRNSKTATNLNKWLAFKHDAYITDMVFDVSEKVPGMQGIPNLIYGASYFSLPIVKYTFFIEEGNVHKWYQLGVFNFPVVEKFFGSKGQTKEIRDKIAMISIKKKYNTNPWATSLRDFVIDFGLWGGILLFFFLGVFFQGIFELGIRTSSIEIIVLASLIGLSTVLLAYSSPLRITYTSQTIYFCIFLHIINTIQRKL
jgi:hypothetical protein